MHNARTKIARQEAGEEIAMLAAPTPRVLLKLETVKARVGLNKTTIYAGMNAGWFPKPVKIGAASRWVESEIDALIVRLTERRDHGKA